VLNRESILAARKLPTETVDVPEWGGTACVKTLTAAEFMALTAKTKADPERTYAHWIIATVVDEQGQPVFKPEDVAAIGEQPISAIERLADAAQRLNMGRKGDAAKN
jgi:hypothetical protein